MHTTEDQHQFTIPVEWVNLGTDAYNGTGYSFVTTGGKITKLRCVCGKEIERVEGK
jgi:hypothetical protein